MLGIGARPGEQGFMSGARQGLIGGNWWARKEIPTCIDLSSQAAESLGGPTQALALLEPDSRGDQGVALLNHQLGHLVTECPAPRLCQRRPRIAHLVEAAHR
jgi:hypothetical protein